MTLTWAALFFMMQQCAPQVHWETMSAIVKVESSANVWAIHDSTTRMMYQPKSLQAADELANRLIAKGHSVDVGVAQINSTNLRKMRIPVRSALEPCRNLQIAQTILQDNYKRALKAGFPHGQPALQASLSAYNTGSFVRGRRYVQKVLVAANSRYPLQPFLQD